VTKRAAAPVSTVCGDIINAGGMYVWDFVILS
jgi:hypothetical protein